MTVIGLTGSFGTGKTFVASLFRSFGAKVIDADSIAHRVIINIGRSWPPSAGIYSQAPER
jgi:dephospho-CoA kinase